MDFAYVKKIQEWVQLDNKLLRSKDETKEILERKKDLEDEILDYVEKNNFDNLNLSISDGCIKFQKRATTQHLSSKVLKTILNKYAKEKKINIDVDDICNYINENLDKKTSIFMKREIK